MGSKTALSQLLEAVTQPTELISQLDQQLLREQQERGVWIQKGFHPSQLEPNQCVRLLVYQKLGVPDPTLHSPQTMRIFGNGTSVGTRLQNLMVRAHIVRKTEIEVPIHEAPARLKRSHKALYEHLEGVAVPRAEQFELRGHADAFSLADETVYEIKSANTRTFDLLRAPMERHLLQASLYAYALKASRIIFLYENKNNQELKEFVVEPNREAVKDALEAVRWTGYWLGKKELPVQHDGCTSQKSPKARRCPYVDVCFGDQGFDELDARGKHKERDYR